jgi:magnesium transporter
MERLALWDGHRQLLDDAAPLPAAGFVWLDLAYDEIDRLAPEVRRLIGVEIFEDHLLDVRNLGHPSYFDNTDDYEMVIFRGLAPAQPGKGVESRPMTIFRFDRLLATVRPPDSRSAAQVKSRFIGEPRRQPRNPDELMHRLLSAMVDHYLDLRKPLTERLERWQSQLLNPRHPFNDWQTLLKARVELRTLEDLCEGQHDAVQEWRDYRLQDMNTELQVRFSDLIEHIHRVLDHVRRTESTIESAVQLHFSAVAYRTSEIMRTLTIITAIFMPLTLITGIFGMNFEMIPGLHNSWGFFASIGLMLIVAAVMLIVFRRRRWL